MLQAPDIKVTYLVGKSDRALSVRPLVPYDELACEFLGGLSSALLADRTAKLYPDVISFAYWCRKANLARLKLEFGETRARLGLGTVFHIAPSNVPINFAFSYAFSLLAGNANIVRAPSKDFPQTGIVCGAINRLFSDKKYRIIAEMTAFVKYPQDDAVTGAFSEKCNARIIWGGDQAINNIRKLPIPERSMEIAFADRYSFCAIDADSVLRAESAALSRLAGAFYNDTYLMDQNACSSPHLVVWLGKGAAVREAKEKFWNSVYGVAAAKYDLLPVNAVDKYTLLCENAIELEAVTGVTRHGNYLYRVELGSLPAAMDALRGQYGFFYEFNARNLDSVAPIINTKYQTLTYFGLEKKQLLDFVVKNRLAGIDRIVPVGSALDIGVIWDGYDLVRSLSRIIDIK